MLLLILPLIIGVSSGIPIEQNNNNQLSQHKNQNEHQDKKAVCGYERCNIGKEGMLNVHLVPHTHDDVGWLKTVDQYYYGSEDNIQDAGVQYIIETAITELYKRKERIFIYVEIAFFYRWWQEQDLFTKDIVRNLVENNQLQFILGGWCMNDEAGTHYNAIIDQHTLGFRFIEDNFGDCGRPRVAWQIDPFGHSREQASLFAQFGFDGLFFGRLDYQDKNNRLSKKEMELLWQGSQSLGDAAALFTGVNFHGYGSPAGFCFDQKCTDPPIMDNPFLEDYNVPERVNSFISTAKIQAASYSTNHIMMTMGGDFNYQNANENFKNLDKLIYHVNERQVNGSGVNAFYSSPNCYLYALNKVNQTYTNKEDDFLPYASAPGKFWTGYFTSRAALKGYARTTNNYFQVVKHLNALSRLDSTESDQHIFLLAAAIGVVQHHDAITGTEKQVVSDDYVKRISIGRATCENVINSAYEKLLPKTSGTTIPKKEFCSLTNISVCNTSSTSPNFTMTVYNPLARPVSRWIRVPILGSNYTVLNSSLNHVTAQIVPISNATKHIPERENNAADHEIVFLASLPALGYTTYFIQQNTSAHATHQSTVKYLTNEEAGSISNEFFRIEVGSETGVNTKITHLKKNVSVNQTLAYYYAAQPGSGAYVFRPNNSSIYTLEASEPAVIIEGKLVNEIRITMNWTSLVARLYTGEESVTYEWTVGPIPVNDHRGREVINLFNSSIDTNGTYYTDSNGREVLTRIRNFRPTWNLTQTQPVSGNYYPVNSRIYIKNTTEDIQLSVLTDRSQGGTSIHDGQVELMLHRRLLYDDGLGVKEALNELGVDGRGLIVRGEHTVFLSDVKSSVNMTRIGAEQLYMGPVISYSPLNITPENYTSQFNVHWSALNKDLPSNIHLLTLEKWKEGSYLIRLEHLFEKGEDAVNSQSAEVSLQNLFKTFGEIRYIEELTLGANQLLKNAKRLSWNVNGRITNGDMSSFVTPIDTNMWTVRLNPMQIRTFQMWFQESH